MQNSNCNGKIEFVYEFLVRKLVKEGNEGLKKMVGTIRSQNIVRLLGENR